MYGGMNMEETQEGIQFDPRKVAADESWKKKKVLELQAPKCWFLEQNNRSHQSAVHMEVREIYVKKCIW